MTGTNLTLGWYTLRSKPRKEQTLYQYISAEDVDCYYPCIRVNPVNPRARKIKPYFPGYMFVHTDLEQVGRNRFRWIPHSLGLVRFGGVPALVPENLIHGIQRTVEKINQAGGEELFHLQPGDGVTIADGPFAGYRGVFDARLSGTERVRVLLSMLQQDREIPVELSVSQLTKE